VHALDGAEVAVDDEGGRMAKWKAKLRRQNGIRSTTKRRC